MDSALAKLRNHDVQIASITATVAEHQTRFSALRGDIQRIVSELQGILTQIGSITSTLAEHQTRFSALSGDSQRIMPELQGALAHIGSITSTLAAHQTSLAELGEDVRGARASAAPTAGRADDAPKASHGRYASLETRLMEALNVQGRIASATHAQLEASLQSLQMQIDELKSATKTRQLQQA